MTDYRRYCARILLLCCLLFPAGGLVRAAPDMVLVEGGTFRMGEEEGKIYFPEKGPRQVIVNSYYMGRYEVTFAEYDLFCLLTGRTEAGDRGWGRGRQPVVNVSWLDATKYCNWLSELEGLTPAYRRQGDELVCDFTAGGYRLPTEAEWEYAARGGKRASPYKYSGGDNPDAVAWYRDNAGGRPHPVGEKRANELGLYDMSGNVGEWCWDRHVRRDWFGPPDATLRACRGGNWANSADAVRVTRPGASGMAGSFSYTGFRLARSVADDGSR